MREETTLIFKEITIEDRPIFKDLKYICSDYEFSYLFMYGDIYKLKISYDSKCVIILSELGKPNFYMPLGDTEYGIKSVLQYCRENNMEPVFTKIPQNYTGLFEGLNFTVKEDRDSFDYIYSNSELTKYEGKRFRKQRNNLYNYLKNYTPVYTDDILNHIDKCKEFTLAHFDNVDIVNPTIRILDNINNLNCFGGIVWNEDKIQAFCIYEKIWQDTVLAHVELTDNSHRGIHAYLINEVSKRINERYINKEDDVGLAGLRRFKESFNPCTMLKKFTAHTKSNS